MPDAEDRDPALREYQLNMQVGYLLRLASQRHATIFQELISADLTPTQFATLIRIAEHGPASQNHLGRLASMDVATTKGVVDRLKSKGLVQARPDLTDKRRTNISLTEAGAALIGKLVAEGQAISDETLAPLSPAEQRRFLALLAKIS